MRENTFHRRTMYGRSVANGLPTVSCIICRCYVWKWKSSLSCNSVLLNFVSRLYLRRVVASSCSFCWLLLTRAISFACRRISLICRMCCCLPAGSRVSSRANEHFSSLRLFCLPKTGGDFRFHFFSFLCCVSSIITRRRLRRLAAHSSVFGCSTATFLLNTVAEAQMSQMRIKSSSASSTVVIVQHESFSSKNI